MPLTRDSLWEYLESKMGLDRSEVADDTLLFSGSVLDSFSMVDLIMFIEQESGQRINPTEVSLDNLDSVQRIIKFVESRQNG